MVKVDAGEHHVARQRERFECYDTASANAEFRGLSESSTRSDAVSRSYRNRRSRTGEIRVARKKNIGWWIVVLKLVPRTIITTFALHAVGWVPKPRGRSKLRDQLP